MPASRRAASSSRCRSMPSCPASPKPAEITTTARTPSRRLPHRADGGCARHGDHRELDRPRNVGHRSIRPHRLDHLGGRVDGIHRAPETGLEQVVEQLAADRALLARGADHGDRPRFEKASHGGRRRDPLAPLEALDCLGRKEVGNRTWIEPGAEEVSTRKPALAKDLDHPVVLRQHLGLERRDPRLVGELREVSKQDRPEAVSCSSSSAIANATSARSRPLRMYIPWPTTCVGSLRLPRGRIDRRSPRPRRSRSRKSYRPRRRSGSRGALRKPLERLQRLDRPTAPVARERSSRREAPRRPPGAPDRRRRRRGRVSRAPRRRALRSSAQVAGPQASDSDDENRRRTHADTVTGKAARHRTAHGFGSVLTWSAQFARAVSSAVDGGWIGPMLVPALDRGSVARCSGIPRARLRGQGDRRDRRRTDPREP